MRRYRRLVVIDRLIPVLAAGLGLIALAGALTVQLNVDAAQHAAADDAAKMQASVDELARRAKLVATPVSAVPEPAAATTDVAALTDRVSKLETALQQARDEMAKAATTSVATGPAPLTFGEAAPAATAAAKPIDPNLPTTDCIPLGTRFMVTPNETYPLCQSKTKIKVSSITADSVIVDGAGPIVETGFGKILGTECTVMVFSADIEGFAELRVTCS